MTSHIEDQSTKLLNLATDYGFVLNLLMQPSKMMDLFSTMESLYPIKSERHDLCEPKTALKRFSIAIFNFLEASFWFAQSSVSFLESCSVAEDFLGTGTNHQDQIHHVQNAMEDIIHAYEIIRSVDREVIAKCVEIPANSFRYTDDNADINELETFSHYSGYMVKLRWVKMRLLALQDFWIALDGPFLIRLSLNSETFRKLVSEFREQMAHIGIHVVKFKKFGLVSQNFLNHPLLEVINKPDVEMTITHAYQQQIKTTLKYLKYCKINHIPKLLFGPNIVLLAVIRSLTSDFLPLQNFMTSYLKMLNHFYDAFVPMVKTELHLARISTHNSAYFLENFGPSLLPIIQYQELIGHHLGQAMTEMRSIRSSANNLLEKYDNHLDIPLASLPSSLPMHGDGLDCTRCVIFNLLRYIDILETTFVPRICAQLPCCGEEKESVPDHTHSLFDVIKGIFHEHNTIHALSEIRAWIPKSPGTSRGPHVRVLEIERSRFPSLENLHPLRSEVELLLSILRKPFEWDPILGYLATPRHIPLFRHALLFLCKQTYKKPATPIASRHPKGGFGIWMICPALYDRVTQLLYG